jgi:hypothetical protein
VEHTGNRGAILLRSRVGTARGSEARSGVGRKGEAKRLKVGDKADIRAPDVSGLGERHS